MTAQTTQVDYTGASTATIVKTYAAVAAGIHSISGIKWSYTSDPAAGDYIKVETTDSVPTTTVLDKFYITKSGPGQVTYPAGLSAPRGQNLVVTLVNGGTVAASLSVLNHIAPIA